MKLTWHADNSYVTEMEHIKASVPEITPPSSIHNDDPMEGVIIKQEITEEEQISHPPASGERMELSFAGETTRERTSETLEPTSNPVPRLISSMNETVDTVQ